MTPAERAVWNALQEHCFNGPTCRPSQELIAERTGYSREYVNRLLRSLRLKGFLTWTRERRPGCRWEHNVYQLQFWVPPLRKKTIRNTQWIKGLRRRDHTERTANSCSRAPAPLLPSSSLNRQRMWSRARVTTGGFVLDELVCARCEPLERENGRLKETLRAMSDENTELGHELAGARNTLRMVERQVARLKAELTTVREESPLARQITEVLEEWRSLLGHRRALIPLDGERAKIVRQALRWHKDPQALIEALRGLALVPYTGPKGRAPLGVEKQRYDDVKYALGSEQRIEEMRDYWRRATRQASIAARPMIETYWKVAALERHWGSLVLDALCAIEKGVEPGPPLEEWLLQRREDLDLAWVGLEAA